MKHTALILVAIALFATVKSAGAAANPAPTGFWMDRAQGWVVETRTCNRGICGYLVAFRNPSGQVLKDEHNPDPNMRDRPQCGMLLLAGFTPSKRQREKWGGGWVYDPDTGETYSGELEFVDPDTVKLRGYVGIPLFGRSLILTRENGATPRCSADTGK